MLNNNYIFTGKHADYVHALNAITDTQTSDRIFTRLIDVYILAPLVGLAFNRKGKKDNGGKKANIMLEQINREKIAITYNYRLIMLIADKNIVSIEERMNRAFRYDANLEKKQPCEDLYNEYVLGGVEVLYEKIIDSASTKEEYLMNLYEFIEDYNTRYNGVIDDVELIDMLNKEEY